MIFKSRKWQFEAIYPSPYFPPLLSLSPPLPTLHSLFLSFYINNFVFLRFFFHVTFFCDVWCQLGGKCRHVCIYTYAYDALCIIYPLPVYYMYTSVKYVCHDVNELLCPQYRPHLIPLFPHLIPLSPFTIGCIIKHIPSMQQGRCTCLCTFTVCILQT